MVLRALEKAVSPLRAFIAKTVIGGRFDEFEVLFEFGIFIGQKRRHVLHMAVGRRRKIAFDVKQEELFFGVQRVFFEQVEIEFAKIAFRLLERAETYLVIEGGERDGNMVFGYRIYRRLLGFYYKNALAGAFSMDGARVKQAIDAVHLMGDFDHRAARLAERLQRRR
ncbi:MAG: hypothetical protein ACD_47C00559G0001, partial [uncultured bacterium]